MKSIQNFAAQQLTKEQMNAIIGGTHVCYIYTESGAYVRKHTIEGASSSMEAANVLAPFYSNGYYAVCGRVVE